MGYYRDIEEDEERTETDTDYEEHDVADEDGLEHSEIHEEVVGDDNDYHPDDV